jgi:hypothetical protein
MVALGRYSRDVNALGTPQLKQVMSVDILSLNFDQCAWIDDSLKGWAGISNA